MIDFLLGRKNMFSLILLFFFNCQSRKENMYENLVEVYMWFVGFLSFNSKLLANNNVYSRYTENKICSIMKKKNDYIRVTISQMQRSPDD